MRCSRCGAENQPGSVVCAACGTPLAQAPVAPVAPVMPGYVVAPAPIVPGKGLGIASMVLGIVSLVFCWTVWFAFVVAIIGCVLGAASMVVAKRAGFKSNGMSIAGLVCSIIALVVSGIWVFTVGIACIGACNAANEVANMAYYYY